MVSLSTTPCIAVRSAPVCRVALPALALVWLIPGCYNIKPHLPPSEGHITKEQVKGEPARDIPPPARASEFLPPPKPAVKPQTYSVVVSEVPVKDLLIALARDTRQNIDVHPGITGLVSLNAINETLPVILERVSRQVNMRYRVEGNTIVVSPDTAYVKTYRVNYVNMARETSSTIGVTGELTISGTGGTGGAGGAAASSGSNTVVRTVSKNDFWDQLRDNIRSILNSTRLQSLTAEAKNERLALVKQEQELRVKQMEAASRAGQGAPTLATSVISAPGSSQQQATLLPDDVVINAASGTVTINATEKQHQLIQAHIDSIVNAMQRQVLIEATIVEVQLSEKYQGGVDWSRLPVTGGPSLQQKTLGGFGTGLTQQGANFFQIGYVDANSPLGNIAATIQLLQEFGNTKVLSSPKLMALNNQTALLKVVDNIVYFEVTSSTSQGVQGSTLQTFTTTAKTVAVGVVMSVTPQVNEDGRVSLTVRPTVTRLRPEQPFVNDPNPSLANPCGVGTPACNIAPILNQVPQIQVREMESVLMVGSGQTVVLGGLMQDEARRARQQIPGADALAAAGELLRFRDEQVGKSELMVFLRPIVVANPSLESDELRFYQRFLPKPEASPPPAENTGTAR
ncbi:MAG TPA: secretin N-terminal domain-containing protein [Burkholderiales bacterium]|nr:secretin N-terminal domain-containing protein [Burkholderiales bacterium]